MPAATTLDVITIGRSSVDLYGQQIGSRLEDIGSFAKSVGGCPANIAIGTARLGLKSGIVTRVGNEQMGRYIREQMLREGVSDRGLVTDPERLTALVLLAVEDEGVSPMIFYRTDCADMALVARRRRRGFHRLGPRHRGHRHAFFARQHRGRAAQGDRHRQGARPQGRVRHRLPAESVGPGRPRRGLRALREVRPRLRQAEDRAAVMRSHRRHRGGDHDRLGRRRRAGALKAIRALSPATIVLKRGAMGCIVYDGPISDDLEDGIVGKGFPIEVYNVLGAGDAFMSGFLRGWLGGESLETSATWANAGGAFAVSRLLCSPEYPTFEELQFFLKNGSPHRALRKDEAINQVHWATTRRRDIPSLMALAIDHRVQLEDIARKAGADEKRIRAFKVLAVKAAARVAGGRPGYGMLIDEKFGREAMFEFARHPFSWLGRPVELPGSRPLRFEFSQDIGSQLVEWPVEHCIKCLCFYHPDDPAELKAEQQEKLRTLFEAARKVGRELLVEIIAGKHGTLADDTIPRALEELYALGIKPDWWKLEPQASASAWQKIEAVIARQRSVVPRRRAARPGSAAARAGGGLRGDRQRADRQGLRGRPHHLQRGGRSSGWPAACPTRRRSPTWPGASKS